VAKQKSKYGKTNGHQPFSIFVEKAAMARKAMETFQHALFFYT
jgi:hypothetical protein